MHSFATVEAATAAATAQRDDEDDEGGEDDDRDDGKRRGGKGSKSAKGEDPLRGLSRAQKRRKLMRIEAEREAAQRRRAAREDDSSVNADDVRYQDPIQQSERAGKAAKRRTLKAVQDEADTAAGATASSNTSNKKKKTGVKRQREADGSSHSSGEAGMRRKVRLMEEGAVDKRFKVKKVKGQTESEPSKKRKPDKSRKSFKSKGKHKRR